VKLTSVKTRSQVKSGRRDRAAGDSQENLPGMLDAFMVDDREVKGVRRRVSGQGSER